ncbi:hypothetical protein Anas_14636 [Armadillidium nasatum]|uniref:Secreted protein n=1 Tax=Armadillidium nasatum TaxID=96803 RepID=A0A5N5SZ38_9CRUS|nr:hypothetical protein Anas_14636 [Armadillidium nasatum]
MMSQFMFVGFSLLVLGVSSQNIPVSINGHTAFVDPEELMTTALYPLLKPQKFLTFDVDQIFDSDNTAYEIEVISSGDPNPNFKATLQKIFKTDLGFSNVTITTQKPLGPEFAHPYGRKTRYHVSLKSDNVQGELSTLAEKILDKTYLELENDHHD